MRLNYGGSMNAPRHYVNVLGYTFVRGKVDGVDCIFYTNKLSNDGTVSFDSTVIYTGASSFLIVMTLLILITSFITIIFGLVGFIITMIIMFYLMDTVCKLFLF